MVCRYPGLVGDVQHIDLVVGDAAALRRGQFGGADVHPPIQLRGIGVDDLATQLGRHQKAEVTLAAGRRPDDGHDGFDSPLA